MDAQVVPGLVTLDIEVDVEVFDRDGLTEHFNGSGFLTSCGGPSVSGDDYGVTTSSHPMGCTRGTKTSTTVVQILVRL